MVRNVKAYPKGNTNVRTYNRLGQLLDIRAKIPDVLPVVRDVVDSEIVRVADRIGPVTKTVGVTGAYDLPAEMEPHAPNSQTYSVDVGLTLLRNAPKRATFGLLTAAFGILWLAQHQDPGGDSGRHRVHIRRPGLHGQPGGPRRTARPALPPAGHCESAGRPGTYRRRNGGLAG